MRIIFGKCSASQPTIGPANRGVDDDWYIQFYFHDPDFNKYPGKLFIKKAGINTFKTLQEKNIAAKKALSEITNLLESGWNPITKKMMVDLSTGVINPGTPLLEALHLAMGRLTLAKSTLANIKSTLKIMEPILAKLGFKNIPISSAQLMHFKIVLDELYNTREGFGEAAYNRARSYLQMLLKEAVQLGAIPYNPIRDLSKRKETVKEREIIPTEVREAIKNYLAEFLPEYLLFLRVFYSSSGRLTELMRMKHEDIKIETGEFKIVVLKGGRAQEYIGAIPNSSLKYWQEAKCNSKPGQYVFSRSFKPGSKPGDPGRATKVWEKHVKGKLGLKYDLYALKATNLTELSEVLDIEDAAGAARHKSTATTTRHYIKGLKKKQNERLRQSGGEL